MFLVEYRSDFSDVTDASRLNPLTHPRVVIPRPVAHRSVGHDGSVGQDGSVGPAVVTVNVWGLGPLTQSRVHVLKKFLLYKNCTFQRIRVLYIFFLSSRAFV